MNYSDNPALAAAKLLEEAGLEVDQDVVDEYALFCDTAVIQGKPLTAETVIIAALVKKLGGSVSISPDELAEVRGLIMDGDSESGLVISI